MVVLGSAEIEIHPLLSKFGPELQSGVQSQVVAVEQKMAQSQIQLAGLQARFNKELGPSSAAVAAVAQAQARFTVTTEAAAAAVATEVKQLGPLRSGLKNIGSAIGGAVGETTKAAASIGGLAASFSGLGVVAGGITAAALFTGMVREAEEAQVAMANTEAVIESTGGTANVTAEDLENLSDRLSRVAAVDDEVIQSAGNLLLGFRNIRNSVGEGNDIFDRTLTAATDLAARFRTDVPTAALILGRALDDPIAGMARLRRANVLLTDEQERQVRTAVAQGDTARAQGVILDEVQRRVGGAAAASATGTQRLNVAIADFEERSGPGLAKGVGLVATIVEKFNDGLEAEVGWLGRLKQAGVALLPFYDQADTKTKDLASSTDGLSTSIEQLMAAMDGLGGRTDEQIDAQTSLAGAELAAEGASGALVHAQDNLAKAEKHMAEVLHGTEAEHRAVTQATEDLTEATRDAEKANRDLVKLEETEARRAAQRLEEAQDNLAKAHDRLDDAIRDEAEAVRLVNEARAAGGDPEKLAEAEERIADAVSSVAKARRELAIAESRVIAGRDAKSIAESVEANARVAEAQERVREAEEAERKAREEQDKVRSEGAEFIRDAEERREDAALAVRDARRDETDATDALVEAERQQREGTDELVAAHDRAEQAAKRVRDATDRLREANEALKPTADEVRDAQLQLADAQHGVEQAALDLATATTNVRIKMAEANGVTLTAIDRQRIFKEEIDKVANVLGPNSPFAKNLQDRTQDLEDFSDAILRAFQLDPTGAGFGFGLPEGTGQPKPQKPPLDTGPLESGDLGKIPGAVSQITDAAGLKSVGPAVHIDTININEAKSARATARETVTELKSIGWLSGR